MEGNLLSSSKDLLFLELSPIWGPAQVVTVFACDTFPDN